MNSNDDDDDDHLCTIGEAAAWCRVTTKTIRRWISEERICAHRLGPRTLRIRWSDLQRMLDNADAS